MINKFNYFIIACKKNCISRQFLLSSLKFCVHHRQKYFLKELSEKISFIKFRYYWKIVFNMYTRK